jgi:hypothetical protein
VTREQLDALWETAATLRRIVEHLEARRLRCVECGVLADIEAHGWRSYRTDDEPPQVEHFCPDCAESGDA